MKTLLILSTVLFALAAVEGSLWLRVLQGEWSGDSRNADFAVLTPEGVGTLCRDAIPPACEAEIPNALSMYTINGTKISQDYVHLAGVTTEEAAAELMPSCAAAGIYPIEFRIQVPPSEIQSYSLVTRRLVYVDPRRVGEENCLLFRFHPSKTKPRLSLEQRVRFQGTLEEVFASGPSLTCEGTTECIVEVNTETGMLNLAFYNAYDLYCTGGACLSC